MAATGSGAVIGAICARGGSKGIPRKNLRPLAGVPLIARAIECALQCSALDRVVVSTEDEEIAKLALECGAEVPFRRPDHLAGDRSNKWDVFRHLVETLEEQGGEPVGVLADLDTGTPLRLPSDIEDSVAKLLGGDADLVVTAYEADRNPYFNMVEVGDDELAHVVIRSPEPITCRQQAPVVYALSPAVYAIRRQALFDYEHWSEARMQIHPIPARRAIDIDSEVEWERVEHLMAASQPALSSAATSGGR